MQKKGFIISTLVATVACIGLTTIFVSNASPYVSIKETDAHSQGIHVVGQIVDGTLKSEGIVGNVSFRLKDESGEMQVVYTGPPQSNLEEARQVVVIGSKEGGVFRASQMLVKCPSKYENKKTS